MKLEINVTEEVGRKIQDTANYMGVSSEFLLGKIASQWARELDIMAESDPNIALLESETDLDLNPVLPPEVSASLS